MKKAFLFCLVSGLVLISCAKEEQNTANAGQSIVNAMEEPEIPTEDLMLESTGVETVTYGEFYSGFPEHFLSRIKNRVSAFNETTTKACVINDNAIRENKLSAQDYIDIYTCYSKGGIVVVLKPTVDGFNTKFQPEMTQAAYYKKVISAGFLVNDKAPAMEDFVVNSNPFFRVKNLSESVLDGGVAYDAIAFCGNNVHYFDDLQASRLLRMKRAEERHRETGETLEEEREVTAYNYGCYADALARWMNEKWSSPTKGGIDGAINNGLVYERSADGLCPHPDKETNEKFTGIIKEKITVNGIYDFDIKRDYYLVDQDVTFYTSKIYPVPYLSISDMGAIVSDLSGDSWLHGEGDTYYIKYFKRWVPKIEMSVNGKIAKLETFSPQAGNSTSTETHTNTTENSYTIGGSVGFSLFGGPEVSLDFSYTEKHSVSVGCSRPKSDIDISFVSDQDNCAVWLYEATDPKTIQNGSNWEWRAGNLLLTTMKQTNSVLFYVDDPDGAATLKVSNLVQYNLWYNTESLTTTKIKKGPNNYFGEKQSFELPPTKRSKQKWNFSFVLPEELDSRDDSDAIVDRIWKKMETAMSQLYPGGPITYEILDAKDETIDNASKLLNMITNQLGLVAKQYGYTGTFTVYLKCDKIGKEIKKKITVS